MKRVASIGADAINNCIFDNVEYDTITGRFTVIANIIDGAFFWTDMASVIISEKPMQEKPSSRDRWKDRKSNSA